MFLQFKGTGYHYFRSFWFCCWSGTRQRRLRVEHRRRRRSLSQMATENPV